MRPLSFLLLFSFISIAACTKAPATSDAPANLPPKVAAPAEPDAAAAAPAAAPAELIECCKQCSAASGRDPAGMDISRNPCAGYPAEFNGGPGVDATCKALFSERRTIVQECWDLAPKTE
jgi:hypothetical protein